MAIISSLFIHSYKIKRSTQFIDTSGKVTHELCTLSIRNRGRFDNLSGSRQRDFMGAVKQASKVLFTDFSKDILVGDVIEDERDCQEYDVVRVDTMETVGGHHLEVYLEQRRRDVV